VRYLKERREELGGPFPARRTTAPVSPALPSADLYEEFDKGTPPEKDGVSTTIAFVRLLSKLIKDKEFGKFVVPIIPDEARTFGMDPFFRMVGIYAQKGQLYEPVDKGLLLYYREATDGQVLEEGITEAGAIASFLAAGTSYATHGQTMVPFYTFYSMFGFQRTGDQIWQFGDMRGKGFLLGATAGRTTLNGEGLQHQDGQSQLMAAMIPNLRAYDPAFGYEIAAIVQDGLRRMVGENEDCFYYVTLQNENYPMPSKPEGIDEGILRGLYLYQEASERKDLHVQLLGSGSILNEVVRARDLLAERFGVSATVWSAPSFQQLRYDALRCERQSRMRPEEDAPKPWVTEQLEGRDGPFIAATDWMKAVPELITRWVPGRYTVLGTDGYGMSDTRAALRRHFEVDAESIALAALSSLAQDGRLEAARVTQAMQDLGYDPEKIDPMAI
jgi:pyruvate dehydrogenase E1 component